MRFLLAGIDFDFSRKWLDYSILDLKDGVVEEYEYDDLKSIIDTTGVKISTGCLKDVIKPCSDLIYDVDNIYMYNGLCKYTSFSLGGEKFFVRLQLCREKNKFIIEIFK